MNTEPAYFSSFPLNSSKEQRCSRSRRMRKRGKRKEKGAKNKISLSNPVFTQTADWAGNHILNTCLHRGPLCWTQPIDNHFITSLTKTEEMQLAEAQLNKRSYFKSVHCKFRPAQWRMDRKGAPLSLKWLNLVDETKACRQMFYTPYFIMKGPACSDISTDRLLCTTDSVCWATKQGENKDKE